ncbi:transcriptional regulator [Cupriavidus sp. 2TAF22]|uniref:helix-turn-helix domain-containing protein n=1 Tax=unclassified Cupriavidus TaxID=2640874 RepID=UPI003F8FEC2B
MQVRVQSASDIGALVRAARKSGGIRQDDAAGSIGVSETFMVRVENGAEGIQWGKLFQVLEGLGIHMQLDLPNVTSEAVQVERVKLANRQSRASRLRAARADEGSHG